ncbi:hypothetical protein [Amycolatopsis australiensis]|uniref:Uncharacterized protein n=1 Tax=Amycolatopsis australiensis TaxID=546364 RepID=A0A1K1SM72_9PSEU|nr:hypothetical protein [Amycolatopsis australiensis]SFW85300.1 hypothetical protein SAMN04489730_6096 [Amycolatopsis australiensis]
MNIAALIAWLVTAVGGFVMLGTWIAKGGTREPARSRFSPGLIFGHFALAAAGLVLWIIYLIAGGKTLAWIAFVLLVPVAALGFTMLARWLPGRRARTTDAPEQHFPVVVVGAHGLVAVATVVLVLLAALGVGNS